MKPRECHRTFALSLSLSLSIASVLLLLVGGACGLPAYSTPLSDVREVEVAFSPNGGALSLLHRTLRQAKESVNVALFHLTHEQLIDALCFLSSRRGIAVRLFTNPDMTGPTQGPILDRLARHGVEIQVLDLPQAKMHLKFVVIDKRTTLIGSANWTQQAFEKNIEDLLVIRSKETARRCLEHLEWLRQRCKPLYGEMSERAISPQLAFPRLEEKGALKASDVLTAPRVTWIGKLNGMDLFFTPDPTGLQRLLDQIRGARQEIMVGMYMLNESNLVEALTRKASECSIVLVADTTMLSGGFLPVLHRLAEAGADVRVFGSDRESMHLKTAVIDRRHVWTGSANWTDGAMSRNVENLIHFDAPVLAKHYLAFLARVYEVSRPFKIQPEQTEADQFLGPYPLPPSGPRKDWRDLNRVPFGAFEVEAWSRYVPDSEYWPVLLDLIRSAHQSVLVCMYVMPEQKTPAPHLEEVHKELKRAAARGVYVYVVLYLPATAADRLDQAHSRWAEKLRADGLDVRLSLPTIPLHGKLVVVDLAKILIGSHNWSEGALSGDRVYESSLLLVQPRQDLHWADYVFSRKVLSDMRRKELWDHEADRIRQLSVLKKDDREIFLRQLEIESGDQPQTPSGVDQGSGRANSPNPPSYDRLWLHDGRTLEGTILLERQGVYRFQPSQGPMEWIPKTSARLVFFGDERKAAEYLKLDQARKLTGTEELTRIKVLPTPDIGRSLLEGVRQATNSIHILAYNLSPCSIPPVSEFFETLREKAQSGVEVAVITEFGSGTSDRLKHQVYEFVITLESAGIEVRFMQERRVMHKKLVLVDGKEMWLGSSNLTLAGFVTSEEINVWTDDPGVVSAAQADFERLRTQSKPASELTYGGGS